MPRPWLRQSPRSLRIRRLPRARPLRSAWSPAAPRHFRISGARTFANISGATAASYTTPATTSADNGSKFDVVVSNSVSSVTSSQATLTVNSAPVAPTITTQPANQTVTAGQTATFSVAASGTAPLTLSMAKKCRRHYGRNGNELHDAGHDHRRQRRTLPRGRQQLRRKRDQQHRHAHRQSRHQQLER